MALMVLSFVIAIYLLYRTLRTERKISLQGEDLSLDIAIGFYDAILGCETEVRIPRLEAISDDVAVQVIRSLKIMVPPGVDAGTRLRLFGEGNASRSGGRAGDLLIQVLAPTKDGELRRKGMNIESEVEISRKQADTGDEALARTIWGESRIVIAAGTSSGDRVVLKGYGVANPKSPAKRGNHIIRFVVIDQ
jgi:DnaJ-class molecular chaperone